MTILMPADYKTKNVTCIFKDKEDRGHLKHARSLLLMTPVDMTHISTDKLFLLENR